MTKHRKRNQSERKREELARKAEQARARAEEASLIAPKRPPDEFSVRAKNSGHRKKTADKWNQ
jgi:hypothetical protein